MNKQETREYWQSMTHEEKLFFAVANANATSFAYGRLQMHRLAAQAQMTRINQAIGSKSTIPEPRAGATQQEMRNYIRHGVWRMQ